MAENEVFNLSDVAEVNSSTVIDITKPVEEITPTASTTVAPGGITISTKSVSTDEVTAKAEAAPTASMKAVPIQTGYTDLSGLKTINTSDILPNKGPQPSAMETEMYAMLDQAVDRECESITERHEALAEAQAREIEDAELRSEEVAQNAADEFALGGKEDEEENMNNAYDPDEDEDMILDHHHDHNDGEMINILDGISNEDLFDDEDDEEEKEAKVQQDLEKDEANDAFDTLKNEIKERITPIRKSLDLSKFTITQKAVSANKAMKLVLDKNMNVADWILPSEGRAVSYSGLSGPEILKLNPENTNRNRLNTFMDMYRIIYNHLVDGNKPEFEVWMKQTRFVDLQHIYFCLYMATFGGSNFVNYSCPKCNKVFIKDIEFKDMVVYADDATKEKVKAMMTRDTTSKSKDTYESQIVQISNAYAVSIRTPSIWNVIIETASLSDKFLEKHADLIDMVAYIDAAYMIDINNSSLIPVDTKPDPKDQAKTAARRIKVMYDIIASLSSEEYYELRKVINEFDEDATKISYQIPECTCKHCGAKIPANTEMNPDNMLFTRHQLAAIGNM